ncbi:hypothetical protein [Algoriphagus sp. CAU 1675]|uniref:hypothetical protein n=1 Tax=Algoriphagus sp. CAU 1675 TaxID=3032597 RepID=UPI0023DAD1F9|nr:hypothetical protein [Algoriphagus sp. CAU 1675]MDF2156511.1 hypothetical protein [Algoriphagus sp. CAU 1675]
MKSKFLQPHFLLPLVLIGLLTGISGGWIRLGSLLIPLPSAAANHGLLMVGGFLGTLISIERAMVMSQKTWLLIPLLTGLSTIPFLMGNSETGLLLLMAGSLGLSVIMHLQTLKHPKFHTVLLYLGAASWFVGNFLAWQSGLIAAGSTWWIGFLMFTIVGERLELSQFLPVPSWSKNALKSLLALFSLGLIIPFHTWGNEIMGLSSLLISAWLLVFDMAKVASKKPGQFRYIGIGLRVGYVWLGLHGLILLGMESHALYYDLMLHTFFLGFTFSMIWAHAPIIFPTIFGIRETPFHPILWVSWLGFQLSLAGRIGMSVVGQFEFRKIFGVTNGYLILLHFILMAGIILWKMNQRKKLSSRVTEVTQRNSKNQSLFHTRV